MLMLVLKSLKISRQLGDKYGMADSSDNIGGILMKESKFEEALPYEWKRIKYYKVSIVLEMSRKN